VGIPEHQRLPILSVVVTNLCNSVEKQGCAVRADIKKDITLAVAALYETGITDLERLTILTGVDFF
jgi:hypothetical protein